MLINFGRQHLPSTPIPTLGFARRTQGYFQEARIIASKAASESLFDVGADRTGTADDLIDDSPTAPLLLPVPTVTPYEIVKQITPCDNRKIPIVALALLLLLHLSPTPHMSSSCSVPPCDEMRNVKVHSRPVSLFAICHSLKCPFGQCLFSDPVFFVGSESPLDVCFGV